MTQGLGLYTHNYASADQDDISTPKAHAGTDAIKLTSKIVFAEAANITPRDDYHPDTRDNLEADQGNKECSWTAESYLLSSGTQGTAPDIASILTTAFSASTNAASEVTADATTTTTLKMDADNLPTGAIGKIAIESASDSGVVSENRYFRVASNTGGALVIDPPFANAPKENDTVSATTQYNTALQDTSYISLHSSDNVLGEMGLGSKLSKLDISVTQGEAGMVTMEGLCRDVVNSVHTTLSAGIDDSTTTVPVNASGNEVGAILLCGTEQMLVTVVDATGLSLTVERDYDGAVAAAHLISVAIGPYEPDETTAGSRIMSLCGGVWINDVQYKTESVAISDDEKAVARFEFGDGGTGNCQLAAGIDFPENRELSFETVIYVKTTNEIADLKAKASAGTAVKVFVQVGTTDGRGAAFSMPAVKFEPFTVPDNKADKIKVTLTSAAVLGTSGEDAFVFAF